MELIWFIVSIQSLSCSISVLNFCIIFPLSSCFLLPWFVIINHLLVLGKNFCKCIIDYDSIKHFFSKLHKWMVLIVEIVNCIWLYSVKCGMKIVVIFLIYKMLYRCSTCLLTFCIYRSWRLRRRRRWWWWLRWWWWRGRWLRRKPSLITTCHHIVYHCEYCSILFQWWPIDHADFN